MSAESAERGALRSRDSGQALPTVRRLTALALTALTVLTVVSLATLTGGTAVLLDAMETVSRDTRGAALASEFEAAVLMHQRLSNLYVVTGEIALNRERGALRTKMQDMLLEAGELVGAEDEQRALDEVDLALSRYLAAREAAEAGGTQLADVVQAVRPALNEVLAAQRTLRALNDAHVLQARAQALRMNRVAMWVVVVAAALMIAGFLIIAWGMGRYLLRPVLSLHTAMASFRTGDLDARAGGGGVREVDDLARMFDDMAQSLSQQRQAQLTFLAGVAHDLKSPLSTLKTGLYLLAHEPSEVRRGATRANLDHQVDLLIRMVDDLLDATRIEAGQLELRLMQFDLCRLVEDVVNLYVPAAPNHQISARLPNSAVTVHADGLRVEQVLRNLVSNAIKFSPYGGPVEVAVEALNGSVEISVSDRGIGISERERKDIFLPFRRRKLETAPGAGLGLSVVRRIVSAHGGEVTVESEPGQGSTFRVTLPRRPDAASQGPGTRS